jgi:hypothetical protein
MKDLELPKKVHGRSAPKTRARSRTAPARPVAVPAEPGVTQDELIPATAPQRTAPASPSAMAARTSGAATAARRAVAARRTPVLAINYDFLRGDIRMLSLLAPSMLVLLVIAFFVLR